MSFPDQDAFVFAPGLSWDQLADNELHRLKRGKHYRGETPDVVKAARAAAAKMKRGVHLVSEPMGRLYYMWIQFNDGEIHPGEPCPKCGSAELDRVDQSYYVCRSCQAFLRNPNALIDVEVLEEDDDDDTEMPEEALETPSEDAGLARKMKEASRRAGYQLSEFTDIRLQASHRTDAKEFHRGVGTNSTGHRMLLLVAYVLDPSGQRIPDPDGSGDIHFVRTLPLWPFEGAVDEDAL